MTARDIVMGAAGSAGDSKTYIEDVFSTYLYTGNGTTQTINNGIDLAGKGGMVWIKNRVQSGYKHTVWDTERTAGKLIYTDDTVAQATTANGVSVFNANGFSVNSWAYVNGSPNPIVSWTFRKAPKFFDVVTWTGDGSSLKTINHSLGVNPGMILIKPTSSTGDWIVGHRGAGTWGNNLVLNGTGSAGSSYTGCINYVSDTSFSVTNAATNTSGATYVAYLFAHDTTTDGLIQCGSFTGAATVNLGWEPQYILVKRSDSTGGWYVIDTMRVWNNTSYTWVRPDLSDSEGTTASPLIVPTATGFTTTSTFTGTWIYMAIRRGPMKTPTDGTKVFATSTNGYGVPTTTNFPVDSFIGGFRNGNSGNANLFSRLTSGYALVTSNSNAQINYNYINNLTFANNTSFTQTADSNLNCNWLFQRAPGFFDVVCYTGTSGSTLNVSHNLGVAPELCIIKDRNHAYNWIVLNQIDSSTYKLNFLDTTNASISRTYPIGEFNQKPTNTTLYLNNNGNVASSGSNYVAYLFASCPGVSKVGSYTGNGSSQTINCGFSAGARFVLIKRTDSTGDWYVWDTARGIVAGNDPHLSLNTTTAEVTTDDTIDPDSTGFIVNQVSATNVNVNAATYIYLAIA